MKRPIVYRISSQSRYDHFDTSPYLSQHQHLRKRGELMGRTSKNIKLRIPEKPRKIKGFRTGSYRVATTISSRSRYDHFDTSPYLSQHQHLRKRGELMGRTKKNIQLKIPEKPRKIKGFRSGSYRIATTISSAARYNHFDTLPCINIHFWGLITRFRVSPVMTTSIPLRARDSRAAWISIAHIRKKSISFSK